MKRTVGLKSFKNFFTLTMIIVAFFIGGIIFLIRIHHNNIYIENMNSRADSIAVSAAFVVEEKIGDNTFNEELEILASKIDDAIISIYKRDRLEFTCVFISDTKDQFTNDSSKGHILDEECLEEVYSSASPCYIKKPRDIGTAGKAVTSIYPVLSGGKVSAVVRVDVISDKFVGIDKYNIYYVLIFILSILLTLLYYLYIFRVVVKPLVKIHDAAESAAMYDEIFYSSDDSGDVLDAISQAIERVRDKQERIDESLSYAREIQTRMLTSEQHFAEAFEDYSIFWKPLAMVSGDFYWLRRFPAGTILICGDCTGHGIPGALMTMMIISLLENIIKEHNCSNTSYILWKLDEQLAAILNRSIRASAEKGGIKDGLDAVIIFIDRNKNISLSSTNMKVFKVKPLNTVEVINGQRFFIGDGKIGSMKNVRTVHLRYEEKVCYFMASDGLFEQVGGERRIPYGYSRFKKIIHRESARGMKKCIDSVSNDFSKYMGEQIQRDDITIIGFKP